MASLYFGNYMFHRFYAFLPLLFIGLLNYFNNKHVGTFIIATAILFLQNYYFMYPALIFLFIFSLMYEIRSNKQFKDILKDFFILLGCLLLGFMISAIITLPSMMYLLNNSRLSETSSSNIFWPLEIYAGLIMSLISINPVASGFSLFQFGGSGHYNWYTLYITILPLLGCAHHMSKKENRSDLVTLVILVLMLVIRPLSSIMHGFTIPSFRWIFVLEFVLLLYGAKGLEDINIKKYKIFFVIYICIFIFVFILLSIYSKVSLNNLKHIIIISLSLILAIIEFVLLKRNKNIAIILSILEIVLFQSYYFYIETQGVNNNQDIFRQDEIDYNIAVDEDVFRYYFNSDNASPASILNQNTSLKYNFMSISTYNSMTDYNIEKFNELANANKDMEWNLSVDDPYACTMLGVKYWIVYKEDELPSELNFSYAYNLDYLSVYENLDYKGFGYTSDKLKYTKDFTSTKDFSDYILIDDESIEISKYTNISYSKLNVTSIYDNFLEANITLDQDNILLISLPNNNGWTIKVNGEVIKPISVNGGFIGLELSSGYNEITMNFISPYFKEGLVLSVIGVMGLMIIMVTQRSNDKTRFIKIF